MSVEYDLYLENHCNNVRRGFEWLMTNLPHLFSDASEEIACTQAIALHDQSKNFEDEYDAYDAYFYGENNSPEVLDNFRKAWLKHIHRNPHHWQHWVLINDDPGEGEILFEMPYDYIIEMICDWWSFSWQKGDLSEIFNWYDEHSAYIKLAPKTRETVEDILWELRGRLGYNVIAHHGIKGQKWGVRNGPPYPLERTKNRKLKNFNNDDIIEADRATITGGPPNGITQVTHKHGGIDRNYHDESGRQTKQITNNDHGYAKQHKYGQNGEHAHDYVYDEDGKLIDQPARELTDEERKENSDIL